MGQPRNQLNLFIRHRALAVMQLRDDEDRTFEYIAEALELRSATHARLLYEDAIGQRAQSRQRKGRKLDAKKVNTIRTALSEGNTQKEIAQWFGINAGTVRKIANGDIWKGR